MLVVSVRSAGGRKLLHGLPEHLLVVGLAVFPVTPFRRVLHWLDATLIAKPISVSSAVLDKALKYSRLCNYHRLYLYTYINSALFPPIDEVSMESITNSVIVRVDKLVSCLKYLMGCEDGFEEQRW